MSGPVAVRTEPGDRLDTFRTLGEFLQVSRATLERYVNAGCPHIDIGSHDPRRRMKRSLRFNRVSVLAWLMARGK